MAQRAVEGIINAFQQGMRQVLAQKEFEASKQERSDQLAEQKRQFDERLKAEQEHQKLQDQLAHAYLDLQSKSSEIQNMVAGQNIGRIYSETGALPPGASATTVSPQIQVPGAQGGGVSGPLLNIPGQTLPGNMTVAPRDVSQDYANLSLPGIGTIQAKTPEATSALLQARKKAEITPQAEVADQHARLLQQLESEAKINFFDYTFPKEVGFERLKNDWVDKREQDKLRFEEWQTRFNGGIHLQIANLAQQGLLGNTFGGSMQIDPETGQFAYKSVNGNLAMDNLGTKVANGDTTLEDLTKLIPNQKHREAFIGALASNNVVPITNKTMNDLKDLSTVSSFLEPLMQAYNEVNEHPYAIQFGLGAKKRYDDAMAIVYGNRAAIVRVMEKVNRYTHQQAVDKTNELLPEHDIGRVFIPGAMESQNKKLEFFMRSIQNNINMTIGNLSEDQQRALRVKNSLPNITQAIYSPGGAAPTPQGYTKPTAIVPQKTAPGGKVDVIDKVTGQKGKVSQKFIDAFPQRYVPIGVPQGREQ